MGLGGFLKDQFIDVIEFVDDSPEKLLVSKFARKGDEIKQGARLVVRNGQAAVFVHRGIIADVFGPVSYTHLDVYKRQKMNRLKLLCGSPASRNRTISPGGSCAGT